MRSPRPDGHCSGHSWLTASFRGPRRLFSLLLFGSLSYRILNFASFATDGMEQCNMLNSQLRCPVFLVLRRNARAGATNFSAIYAIVWSEFRSGVIKNNWGWGCERAPTCLAACIIRREARVPACRAIDGRRVGEACASEGFVGASGRCMRAWCTALCIVFVCC